MPIRSAGAVLQVTHRLLPSRTTCFRTFHLSVAQSATPVPIGVVGPPPSPPSAPTPQHDDRAERRRRQAEMLQKAKELRPGRARTDGKQAKPLRRRFWDEVHVKEIADEAGQEQGASSRGGYRIFLDNRPVRTPHKTVLTLPASKPHLAEAIALEWDLLTSAQQALKNHAIPLTSLTSRADELIQQDLLRDQQPGREPSPSIRADIIKTVMRYLDTDTLLCFAPATSLYDGPVFESPLSPSSSLESPLPSLRTLQLQTAKPILSYLTTHIWPDITLHHLPFHHSNNNNNNKNNNDQQTNSFLPAKQPPHNKSTIQSWISSLAAYDLVALERAVLATKSLLVAARLLVEWSDTFRPKVEQEADQKQEQIADDSDDRFGIVQAADASTLELRWQTARWGQVEDSHDVEREDLIRQLGSVVILVS